ncbi:bacteriohemerythrin [Magnetofaba australis]|uniref:Putative hemerythrin-like metal-binding protein n=1 Tax=Magnetofaba australis IT-1 TaxID=1434232 RepID=A0A1Y2KBH1_9PROT|nr:hemerythrin domain-containing protein [Magnetofaba australis]OSM07278.1 putative hemerythrin-like metal-binding protein [Magnetofaba australis IT-1]
MSEVYDKPLDEISDADLNKLPGQPFRERLKDQVVDVGFSQFNDSHNKLMDLILDADVLFDLMLVTGNTAKYWGRLEEIVDDLVTYTKQHFAEEEEFLISRQHAKINEHTAQHSRLVEELNDFQKSVTSQNEDIIQMRKWLLEWLLVHVNTHDLSYKELAS